MNTLTCQRPDGAMRRPSLRAVGWQRRGRGHGRVGLVSPQASLPKGVPAEKAGEVRTELTHLTTEAGQRMAVPEVR